MTSYIVISRQKTEFDHVGYVYERCLITATSDLRQADSPTSGSSNVNL